MASPCELALMSGSRLGCRYPYRERVSQGSCLRPDHGTPAVVFSASINGEGPRHDRMEPLEASGGREMSIREPATAFEPELLRFGRPPSGHGNDTALGKPRPVGVRLLRADFLLHLSSASVVVQGQV